MRRLLGIAALVVAACGNPQPPGGVGANTPKHENLLPGAPSGQQANQEPSRGVPPAPPSADDQAVASDVRSALATPGIDVTSRDGVVTLTGSVASDDAKRALLEKARAVKGVQRVEDHLQVALAGPRTN